MYAYVSPMVGTPPQVSSVARVILDWGVVLVSGIL